MMVLLVVFSTFQNFLPFFIVVYKLRNTSADCSLCSPYKRQKRKETFMSLLHPDRRGHLTLQQFDCNTPSPPTHIHLNIWIKDFKFEIRWSASLTSLASYSFFFFFKLDAGRWSSSSSGVGGCCCVRKQLFARRRWRLVRSPRSTLLPPVRHLLSPSSCLSFLRMRCQSGRTSFSLYGVHYLILLHPIRASSFAKIWQKLKF